MGDLRRSTEAGLEHFLVTGKLSRKQKQIVRATPTLIKLIAHQCADALADEAFPENAAALALAQVGLRVADNAVVTRRQAVREWFWQNERLLYPFCEAVCLYLKVGRTELMAVATHTVSNLAALPADKSGLISKFGLRTFYSKQGDSVSDILAVLQGPRKIRRRLWKPEGVDAKEIETLAQVEPSQEPSSRPGISVFTWAFDWAPPGNKGRPHRG